MTVRLVWMLTLALAMSFALWFFGWISLGDAAIEKARIALNALYVCHIGWCWLITIWMAQKELSLTLHGVAAVIMVPMPLHVILLLMTGTQLHWISFPITLLAGLSAFGAALAYLLIRPLARAESRRLMTVAIQYSPMLLFLSARSIVPNILNV